MSRLERENVMVQVLAGGRGINLLEETKGKIPKSLVVVKENIPIMDVVVENTRKQGLNRFVFSLGLSEGCFGVEIYKHLIDKGYGAECMFEEYGGGNAKSIQKLAETTKCKYPLFVLCSDMLLPWDAMDEAISFHKTGTVTWITSSTFIESMNRYFGLKVRKDGAVVYDSKVTPEGQYLDDGDLTTVTKGGSLIIDPNLFVDVMKQLEKNRDNNGQIDIFWDVIPYIERLNWKRLEKGKSSLINAVVGKDPVMDIGTPERLTIVREYLNNEK